MLNRSEVLSELDAERLRAVEAHEHFAFLLLRVHRHREEHQLFGDFLSMAARTRIRREQPPGSTDTNSIPSHRLNGSCSYIL